MLAACDVFICLNVRQNFLFISDRFDTDGHSTSTDMNQLVQRVCVHIHKFSAHQALHQTGLTFQKVGLSSSSEEESRNNSDKDSLKQNAGNNEMPGVQSLPKWASRRRRLSLSPAERLSTALSGEEGESRPWHSRETNKKNSDLEGKPSDPLSASINLPASESAKAGTSELKAEQREELSTTFKKKLRRRTHLSPLKRFSEMIPDKYWKENKDGTSVKQDLDELIKSDGPPKKTD